VTLHSLLTPETRHLIDAEALRAMKPSAYLINAARGPIVDEAALVRALTERWIAGAGLDVFERNRRSIRAFSGSTTSCSPAHRQRVRGHPPVGAAPPRLRLATGVRRRPHVEDREAILVGERAIYVRVASDALAMCGASTTLSSPRRPGWTSVPPRRRRGPRPRSTARSAPDEGGPRRRSAPAPR